VRFAVVVFGDEETGPQRSLQGALNHYGKSALWRVSNSLLRAPWLYFWWNTFAARGSAAVSNFQFTFDVQLMGQKAGCVVVATWPAGIHEQPVGECFSCEHAEQSVAVALKFAIRAYAEEEQRGSLKLWIAREQVRIGHTKIRKWRVMQRGWCAAARR